LARRSTPAAPAFSLRATTSTCAALDVPLCIGPSSAKQRSKDMLNDRGAPSAFGPRLPRSLRTVSTEAPA
jgi:hypothetical protein